MTEAKDITAGADHSTSEAEAALAEIDQAAQIAFKNLETEKAVPATSSEPSFDSKAKAALPEPGLLSQTQKNDRIKLQSKRANNQREKGRAELTRNYAGAMTIEHKLAFNDLNVASSCERFLGTCDLAPYTIGRRGPSVLGTVSTNTVMQQLFDLTEKYYLAGKEAQTAAETLFGVEKEKVLSEEEWVTPVYKQAAFEMVIQAKHRGTSRLIAGMRAWDEAIRIANVLEWNGAIMAAEIAEIRSAERKAFNQVFILSNRSIVGLYKGTIKAEPRPRNEAVSADSVTPTPSEVGSGQSQELAIN